MIFTKIPADTFKEIQLNAGILLSAFAPETGKFEEANMLGATSGGISFTDTPEFSDFGDDIDNCPKNTKELKKLVSHEVKISGTFVSLNTARAKSLVGAADVEGNKITPRNDLEATDFSDIWFVGDYGEGGFIAIHVMNALSTGGFQIQSTDRAKGQFTFEYMGHYSMTAQDTVPYEIYIKKGEG